MVPARQPVVASSLASTGATFYTRIPRPARPVRLAGDVLYSRLNGRPVPGTGCRGRCRWPRGRSLAMNTATRGFALHARCERISSTASKSLLMQQGSTHAGSGHPTANGACRATGCSAGGHAYGAIDRLWRGLAVRRNCTERDRSRSPQTQGGATILLHDSNHMTKSSRGGRRWPHLLSWPNRLPNVVYRQPLADHGVGRRNC
jgi:hypothetical protein